MRLPLSAQQQAAERRAGWTAALCFMGGLAYALLKYVLLGATPAAHVPLYVVNKAIAVTALLLLGTAVTASRSESRRAHGLLGAAFAILHLLLTIPTLTPAYHRRLFANGTFTMLAELSVLAGGIATVVLLALVHSGGRWSPRARAALPPVVLGLVGTHLVAMGAPGWRITLTQLPSISLLSFGYVAFVLLSRGVAAIRARTPGDLEKASVAALIGDPAPSSRTSHSPL